jgi:predicted tellurium resistance membrane protein TerC
MSLDNVLAVAGAARGHLEIMVAGLSLSILMMAVAADLLARLLERQRWIAWVGLAIVFYVSLDMMVTGWGQVAAHFGIWGGRA